MANTVTVDKVTRGNHQFQGAFKEMFLVKATIVDNNVVALTDSVGIAITAPGVAIGDIVICHTVGGNPIDSGGDRAVIYPVVSDTDEIMINIHADAGAFGASTLNGYVMKILVGRPSW